MLYCWPHFQRFFSTHYSLKNAVSLNKNFQFIILELLPKNMNVGVVIRGHADHYSTNNNKTESLKNFRLNYYKLIILDFYWNMCIILQSNSQAKLIATHVNNSSFYYYGLIQICFWHISEIYSLSEMEILTERWNTPI